MATVSTINTIEDLVRIMDERPEWVEAMRARLLTREVLELPQRISTLADKVDKYVESTNRRLDNIGTRLDGHDSRFDQMDARFDAVDARFDLTLLMRGLTRWMDPSRSCEMIWPL